HGATRLRPRDQLDLPGLRQRRHQHPPPGRQEGNARGGRAPGHASHGGFHARAQPRRPRRLRARHARHPHDPRRGRADHGGPRLDKASMREFLWEHSRIPAEHVSRAGGYAWIEIDASKVTRESATLDPWPITSAPDNFILIVAGGGHPTNSYWLQGYSPGVIGREIRLPGDFARLVAAAEQDLYGEEGGRGG